MNLSEDAQRIEPRQPRQECAGSLSANETLIAPLARELAQAGLDSVNVSFDTLDPTRYRELTRGGVIEDALAGIAAARAAGLPVKLNMVIMEGGDPAEIARMREFADGIGARVQLINHYELFREKGDTYAFDRPPACAGCNRIRLTADGMFKPSCIRTSRSPWTSPGSRRASARRWPRSRATGERARIAPCGRSEDDHGP